MLTTDPAGRSWAVVRRRISGAEARLAHLGSARRADAYLVTGFMALAIVLRLRTLGTSYWGDEAIALGIAVHPLASLPHFLAQDGSPPLYYVALHYWVGLFGRSSAATHALSLIGAVLAVPAAWWAGDRLFGRWPARAATALVATCAYLDYYATETRMYSWLALFAILEMASFVIACRRGGWRWWAQATLLMTGVLYLQYYGLYLLCVCAAIGLYLAGRQRDRKLALQVVGFTFACVAAFAPWMPQFDYQLRNTGAPWAPHPNLELLIGDVWNSAASAAWPFVTVAMAAGIWAAVQRRLRARPLGQRVPSSSPTTLAICTAVPALTIAVAFVAGQFVNSWNPRYMGIAVVPAFVAIAGGLATAPRRFTALAIAVVGMTATAVPMLVDRPVTVLTSKSNAAYILSLLRPKLHRGALVISSDVTYMPAVAVALGPGYRYATALGPLSDPLVVNWSDLPTRLQGVSATSHLGPLLASLPVGGQVLLVNRLTWGGTDTPSQYLGPVHAEGIAATNVVTNDPSLQEVAGIAVPRYSNPLYPVAAKLFVKVGATGPR
ncbi:MAG TPA: glycosyltransferase family 39 protein [Acidimicrobiales bacterium]|nr:glycosyltransferase family 39 protein [Acidimicrobiales bacterium]